jgi:apolipoprotein N-acyltransferase
VLRLPRRRGGTVRKRSARVAWLMLVIFATSYGVGIPLSVANGNAQRQPGFLLALLLAFTAFMVVGAVIVAHRPGNAVGWIFSAIGLLAALRPSWPGGGSCRPG